jgi:adenylate cyclase
MTPQSASRAAPWIAIALVVTACLWALSVGWPHFQGERSPLDRLEAPLADWRQALVGRRASPPDVVIVAIDDDTVRRERSFPLHRLVVARLISAIAKENPRVVAVDILFIDPHDPGADTALAAALRSTPSVIASAAIFDPAKAPSQIPEAVRLVRPVPVLENAAATGVVNLSTDHAGTPRHVPLLVSSPGGLAPSFALRTASLAGGTDPVFSGDRLIVGGVETRLDVGKNLPLRFYGPAGTIPTIGAWRVLDGEPVGDFLKGRVVVVGSTAVGGGDTFPTPFDSVLPGVEVLATAIAHLLSGDGLVRDTGVRRTDLFAAAGLAGLTTALISLAPLGLALGASVSAILAWLGVGLLGFGDVYWFSAVLPIAAAAPPAVLAVAIRHVIDRRGANRVMRAGDALRVFQPPLIAERLASDPAFLSRPRVQDAAVLFIDLSGFTRISERLGPERTRSFLEQFHALIEDEVTRGGGVVMSFMGDGAMIVFGLPEARADDAARALEAAFALPRRILAWLATEPTGRAEETGVRLGAHHGRVVMSRLGSKTHQHITATGDCVNVASRLMEVAAQQGATIAVSADLVAATRDPLAGGRFEKPREVAIRGRREALQVYVGDVRVAPEARA